jgi:anti-sigma regulatory factor (Ser/Thr protein kinase)
MPEIALALPAVPASIPRARNALAVLRGSVEEARLEDLRLVVSELVTNSIRHADLEPADAIDLRVRVEGGRIRLELHDPGRGFEPRSHPASRFQESGWGLFIVAQLADRWGVDEGRPGITVWAEIDR